MTAMHATTARADPRKRAVGQRSGLRASPNARGRGTLHAARRDLARTHEFYRECAEITRRLILEKGCMAIAVEADWPDSYRVNRYVRGVSEDADANAALFRFKRFPGGMWRNSIGLEVRALAARAQREAAALFELTRDSGRRAKPRAEAEADEDFYAEQGARAARARRRLAYGRSA